MSAKVNSKTHLQNTFLNFLSRFVSICSVAKGANIPIVENQEKVKRTQNFMLISYPLKQFLKNTPKQSYK
jgi:hypothetical protein